MPTVFSTKSAVLFYLTLISIIDSSFRAAYHFNHVVTAFMAEKKNEIAAGNYLSIVREQKWKKETSLLGFQDFYSVSNEWLMYLRGECWSPRM